MAAASPAAAAPAPEPQIDARAWALIDPADGELLAAHDAARSYPVASTTKLMTAFVARQRLGLDEKVVAPVYSPVSSAESLLGLIEGERITTRDLLYGLILASGNDAAVALADATSGSVDAFVAQMNRTARRLGLDDTSYGNPIGLDQPDNYSSAADLVDLAAKLREDRVFRQIFDAPEAVLESGAKTRQIVNRNNLVRTVPFVDGVKTGYTIGAGNVLVASGSRRGISLISAVLGAPSEAARDAGSLELLEYGFSLYRTKKAVGRREQFAAAEVRYQDRTLSLVAAEPIKVTVRREQRIETRVDAPRELEGPVTENERLGQVVVTVDGEPRGRTALLAAASVPATDLGDRIDSALPGPAIVAWLILTAALVAVVVLAVAVRRRSGSGG